MAFKLRQMHLVNESMKESKASMVVPTAYAEDRLYRCRDRLISDTHSSSCQAYRTID